MAKKKQTSSLDQQQAAASGEPGSENLHPPSKKQKKPVDQPLFKNDEDIKRMELLVNTVGVKWCNSAQIDSATKQQRYFEPALVQGTHMMIPIELLANPQIFDELFSMETWNKKLSADEKMILSQYLPNVNDKARVVQDLFNKENFFFGNDVKRFVNTLQSGE